MQKPPEDYFTSFCYNQGFELFVSELFTTVACSDLGWFMSSCCNNWRPLLSGPVHTWPASSARWSFSLSSFLLYFIQYISLFLQMHKHSFRWTLFYFFVYHCWVSTCSYFQLVCITDWLWQIQVKYILQGISGFDLIIFKFYQFIRFIKVASYSAIHCEKNCLERVTLETRTVCYTCW